MWKYSLALASIIFGGASQATEVTFTNVESYLDASFDRPRSGKGLNDVQEGLRNAFFESAAKYLAPKQTITIEVTGIDLAGRLEPVAGSSDIRVMHGASWPRLEFTYTLMENGAVMASGRAEIADRNYLDGFNSHPRGERLRYERKMLSTWFRKTFGKPA